MPGAVTHYHVFRDSVRHLSVRKKKSYLLKSIESLFSSGENLRAGCFGAMGPDIFDYVPGGRSPDSFGNGVSFFLHDKGCRELIPEMIKIILNYRDNTTEWSAAQRAYLYGFISHIIADSILYPYMFFFAGFPGSRNKKEVNHFRERNLLFQYSIDNYLLHYGDDGAGSDFLPDRMVDIREGRFFRGLNPPVKSIILASLNETFPGLYDGLIIREGKGDYRFTGSTGYLDLVPVMMRLAFFIKTHRSQRLRKFIRTVRSRDLFYSDLIVQYPEKKRINRDFMNQHRERWNYPTGRPGFNYDSVVTLMQSACERTVELWETIEDCLYTGLMKNFYGMFDFSAYTGESDAFYHDMKVKEPVKLFYF